MQCYFDISINGKKSKRMVFELFSKELPITCRNFYKLCQGVMNKDNTRLLSYRKSKFHRIIPGFMAQGGDFTKGDGTGGESIYGSKFKDESFKFKHTQRGLLSMANAGSNTNGSQFFITFKELPHLNGKHVVFGKVIEGNSLLNEIEALGSDSGKVKSDVLVKRCGVIDKMEVEEGEFVDKYKSKEKERGKDREKDRHRSRRDDRDSKKKTYSDSIEYHKDNKVDKGSEKKDGERRDRDKDRKRRSKSKERHRSKDRDYERRKDKKRSRHRSKSKDRSKSRHKGKERRKSRSDSEKRRHRQRDDNKKKNSRYERSDKKRKESEMIQYEKENQLISQKLEDNFIGNAEEEEAKIIAERKKKRELLRQQLGRNNTIEVQQTIKEEAKIPEYSEQEYTKEVKKFLRHIITLVRKDFDKDDDDDESDEDSSEEEIEIQEIGRRASVQDKAQIALRKMIDQTMKRKEDQEVEEEKEEEKDGKIVEEEEHQKEEKKDLFDMFSDTPVHITDDLANLNVVQQASSLEWDDDEHYLKVQVGEILNKQFQITDRCGKGVFSTVVKGIDVINNRNVAIKILRSDEIFIRAGEREAQYLHILNDSDKNDKKHIMRIYDQFEYKKHLCLVFELLERDLRQTLRIYGKKKGLNLDAVQSYGRQLFLALAHLRKHGIIHSDLKPDNLLTDGKSKTVKLCDFGTAFPTNDILVVEELQSRFYRAPEVMLGCKYDTGIDMWSAGCCLYELYTGQFLFPGKSNNEMLKLIQLTKGRINNKMIRKGQFAYQHFDQNYNFLSTEIDQISQKEYVKPMKVIAKQDQELGYRLNQSYQTSVNSDEDKKMLTLFKDLLEKTLVLDPKKRITPEESLKHPFMTFKKQIPQNNQQ